MLETYDDLLTTDEACEALKVGKNALYALLAEKKLKAYKNGRVWRIPRLAVEEFIKNQANLWHEESPGLRPRGFLYKKTTR